MAEAAVACRVAVVEQQAGTQLALTVLDVVRLGYGVRATITVAEGPHDSLHIRFLDTFPTGSNSKRQQAG